MNRIRTTHRTLPHRTLPHRASPLRTDPAAAELTRWGWLDWWLLGILFGYILFGRAFAHVGVRPLFIGEMTLGVFFLFRYQATVGTITRCLVNPTPLTPIAWCTYFLIVYGVVEVIRGIGAGHARSVALQNVIFNIYPLFVWIGLYVGLRHGDLLRKITLPLAWCNAAYGLIYVLVLGPLGLTVTAHIRTFSPFGQPNWSGPILIALVTFGGGMRRAGVPIVLNGLIFLVLQSRASWLAFMACLPVWAVLSGRIVPMLKLGGTVVTLLAVGYVFDVRLPSPPGRHSEEISVRSIVGQVMAVVDQREATRSSDNFDTRASTIEWRIYWWKAIWRDLHSGSTMRALIGPGYGYPIWDLHEDPLEDFPLRTPHSVVFYTLGYTGWIGLLLFALMDASLLVALWVVYRRTGESFGICIWILGNVAAVFDPYFETPYYAIVFYLLVGVSLAGLWRKNPGEPGT